MIIILIPPLPILGALMDYPSVYGIKNVDINNVDELTLRKKY